MVAQDGGLWVEAGGVNHYFCLSSDLKVLD